MKTVDLFYKPLKQLAVLIDPDKLSEDELVSVSKKTQEAGADFIFVGGSMLTTDTMYQSVRKIKENSKLPVVIFPGSHYQLSSNSDALLFLTLISGRNAESLIGMHVLAAPYIKLSGVETIPTGYMLIDSGKPTSVSYMSNSFPIPNDKKDIAGCTAMAGEMLGLKLIFMDAGSGAERIVPEDMIRFVKDSIDIPVVIGGGIRDANQLRKVFEAGADVAVVGNRFEEDPDLIAEFTEVVKQLNAAQ